ncbi:MAG: ribosome biogenesis GTPase YlqF [Firmicutes bacterium]|nr:ribosome biogenesis GTPase YlqF [Bacillota bacterium]
MKSPWFPGHMARAKRELQALLKFAHLTIVVLDSRAPFSSLNPDFEKLFTGKEILYLLNKSDLAETDATKKWLLFFNKSDNNTLIFDALTGRGANELFNEIKKLKLEIISRRSRKKIQSKNIRILVCGIPNAGKSSVINVLAGRARARTGKKAGVTVGVQWINLPDDLSVMDTPGILMPRIKDSSSLWKLALTGAIKDEVLPLEEIAEDLLNFLQDKKVECPASLGGWANERGFLSKGGEPDLEKAALNLIKTFREGKFGRITLEMPE